MHLAAQGKQLLVHALDAAIGPRRVRRCDVMLEAELIPEEHHHTVLEVWAAVGDEDRRHAVHLDPHKHAQCSRQRGVVKRAEEHGQLRQTVLDDEEIDRTRITWTHVAEVGVNDLVESLRLKL